MPSPARRATSERRVQTPVVQLPPRSRALALLLVASVSVPLVILLALFFADVKLGQGYFFFRYSLFSSWRLQRTLPLLLIGSFACGGVWAVARPKRSERIVGGVLLVAAMLGMGAWNWLGPPEPLNQQAFNIQSFSTDGAFMLEASKIDRIRDYLRDFPTVTLETSVQDMGGTRVLSNPPGTTILAYAARQLWARPTDSPGGFEQWLIDELQVFPRDASRTAEGLRFSVLLTVIWCLSGFAAYGLGRLFLSPAGAAVIAVIITFNPGTAHLSPGKDPGQLLTLNLMLLAWFAGWQRKSIVLAAIGGAILAVGSLFGLVHIWVALIALLATAWESWHRGTLATIVRNSLAACAGGAIVCGLAYLLLDCNLPRTLLAVSRKWTSLQSTFDMNRAVWYGIGLPIFLLFLSPGVWTLLGLSLRRQRMGFGARLAICTVAVMLLIYFPLGVTYELPRLWIAFLPTLTLGLAIDRPLFRGNHSSGRAITALVLIMAMQIAFTALHWTLLDAREAEYRLSSARFFS